MKKVVFLASGGGGNLAFLHTAIDHYAPTSFHVVGVIDDRPCSAIAEHSQSKAASR